MGRSLKILNPNTCLDEFFKRVNNSLLLLDYDGTLAPFVQDRMKAFLYPGVEDRLKQLMSRKGTKLVVISGRSLADLETLMPTFSELEFWGSHGLERRLSSGKTISFNAEESFMKGLKIGIAEAERMLDSQYLEKKPYSISLHRRGVDETKVLKTMADVEKQWEKIIPHYDMEIHHFNKGVELRLKSQNKAQAVQTLITEVSPHTAIAYLGDDKTDEEAFAGLGSRGLKVLVREQLPNSTLADIQLIPPKDLLDFLDRWYIGTL